MTAEAKPSAEQTALERVKSYISAHNRHDLQAVENFYANDAVFQLNGGRAAVHGREEIAKLETFDVAAASHVAPQGLAMRMDGENVVVSLKTVVERSRIFSAVGLPQVTTASVDAFIVRPDGRFSYVAQPEFNLSCRQIISAAFQGSLGWLAARTDQRALLLTRDGSLVLTAATIPAMISAIKDWRRAKAWTPDSVLAARCVSGADH